MPGRENVKCCTALQFSYISRDVNLVSVMDTYLIVTETAIRMHESVSESPASIPYQGHTATNMLPRSSMLHTLKLAGRQGQPSILRSTLQRRFASGEPAKLVGPMDNAFNRERLAVKHHAAQSAGNSPLKSQASRTSYADNIKFRSLAETLYLVLRLDANWDANRSPRTVSSYLPLL